MQISDITPEQINSAEISTILNNVPIFDKLNTKEVRIISGFMDVGELNDGEILFREGDKGDYVCFIVHGEIEILKTSMVSNDTVISIIGRGRSIGEMSIIDDYPRSATVRAKKKTKLLILSRKKFDLILDEHTSIGIKILKGIARLISMNLRKTSSRLADYMTPLN